MAQVILSNVGQQVGGPIGQFIGSTIGKAIDNRVIASLSPARQKGPRLEALSLQSSADGAPMGCVFGRARVTGQVIWAARFLETKHKRSGGKGGQKTVEYEYSLSFAVGLGEGPIDGVGRVWADGQPLDLTGVTMRVHRGTKDQTPDPLIEAVEGAASAFRGTAYVVFEDLPLGAFGSRAPQLAFEVFRRPMGVERRLEDRLEGVCLIPGAGEFCLATEAVMRREGLTKSRPENVNNAEGRADIEVSLDQLMVQAPNLKRVSLIVGWFGDDLRAGHCQVRPGVDRRDKMTRPMRWSVAGLERHEAHLVSQVDGGPAYGGTPSDESVRQAIRSLKARGLEVTLYPFVFMDCPGYPWRGRVAGTDGAGGSACGCWTARRRSGSGRSRGWRRSMMRRRWRRTGQAGSAKARGSAWRSGAPALAGGRRRWQGCELPPCRGAMGRWRGGEADVTEGASRRRTFASPPPPLRGPPPHGMGRKGVIPLPAGGRMA